MLAAQQTLDLLTALISVMMAVSLTVEAGSQLYDKAFNLLLAFHGVMWIMQGAFVC
jgi:hypothetical protein